MRTAGWLQKGHAPLARIDAKMIARDQAPHATCAPRLHRLPSSPLHLFLQQWTYFERIAVAVLLWRFESGCHRGTGLMSQFRFTQHWNKVVWVAKPLDHTLLSERSGPVQFCAGRAGPPCGARSVHARPPDVGCPWRWSANRSRPDARLHQHRWRDGVLARRSENGSEYVPHVFMRRFRRHLSVQAIGGLTVRRQPACVDYKISAARYAFMQPALGSR